MEAARLLAILRRWWWLLLLGIALGGGASYAVSRAMTPTYRATTTLLVNQSQTPGVIAYNDILTSERLTKTYGELVTKRPVLEEVISLVGQPKDVETLRDMVSVGVIRDTQLLRLSVEGDDPALATILANATAQAFIAENDVTDLSRAGSVSVVELATMPTSPVKPQVVFDVVLGLIAGLLVAAGLVLLMEYLDDTVKSEQDVERVAGLTTLGMVARFGRRRSRQPVSGYGSRALRAGRWLGRALAAWELWKTRRYERQALGWMDGAVATTEADCAALRGPALVLPVRAVPNGVDSDYFRLGPDISDGRTLVFLGNMRYHANVASVLDFVRRVMPLVWERHPRSRLLMVGADPSAEVRRLGRDACIIVTGYVKDVRPFLARATIGVCPIVYGAGIQNKALEFMAAGLPMVASPQACSGLEARPGEHLLSATEPAEWAEAICGLLDSPGLRPSLGVAGRDYVVRHHPWEEATSRLEEAYEEVLRYRRQAVAA